MAEFDAGRVLRETQDRRTWITSGEVVLPVLTAVIAVLAALATLFAHHSSIVGLAQKNEATLYQSKAADQWNLHESGQVRVQVDRAFIDAGLLANGSEGRRTIEERIAQQNAASLGVLEKAQALEAQSDALLERSQRYMGSYENYQVAATLFEVSIVLISLTALMRTKILVVVGGCATIVGLGFLIVGFLH